MFGSCPYDLTCTSLSWIATNTTNTHGIFVRFPIPLNRMERWQCLYAPVCFHFNEQLDTVLKSLGLGRKIGRPVFQPHEASAAGKILKVKELVKVENIAGPIPAEGFQRTRATKGYKVVGKL